MKNHMRSVGLQYMEMSYDRCSEIFAEGQGALGKPGEPRRFKVYKDVDRYPLLQTVPLQLGDVRQSFTAFQQDQQRYGGRELSYEQLSTYLYYTFGFSRHDSGPGGLWPYHRFVPSARCFFPTEFYLWLPERQELPAGIYHYDNLHHCLELLRAGDYREVLKDAFQRDIAASRGIIFVSSYFWKCAFRYRNFAYRLCTQEAGIVLGNALLVAGTLGIQTRVHYQFLDRVLNGLLGFEEYEESVLAAIALFPEEMENLGDLAPDEMDTTFYSHFEPSTIAYEKESAIEQEKCRLLIEIDQSSFLEEAQEFVPDALHAPACEGHEKTDLDAPAVLARELELTTALYSRNSGHIHFAPLYRSIETGVFWEIIRYTANTYVTDLSLDAIHPFSQVYVLINNVQGIAAGIYRWCHEHEALQVISEGDFSKEAYVVNGLPHVNCVNANMVFYIVADYPALNAHYGNRSYRVMQMECGLVAQRICALSGAFRLSARCTENTDIQKCRELLRLEGTNITPLFLITVGKERAGQTGDDAVYRHLIRC